MFRHLRNRPTLLSGIVVALITTGVSLLFIRASHAVLVGWCCGALTYLLLSARLAVKATVATMQARAESLDPGSSFIFSVAILAAIASISAIVIDLGQAKGTEAAGLSIMLAGATLVLSWLFIHTVFAFHYAHIFYLHRDCLVFPGATEPDYWDFVYFSCVIGMTAQVSDVTTGTARIRRLVLVHSIVAFFFNTAILALGVNLAAGLAA